MADRKDDESADPERDEQEKSELEGEASSDVAEKASAKDESEEDASEEENSEEETDEKPSEEAAAEGDADLAARTAEDGEEEEDEILPSQLGTQRYVFAAFFAGVIVCGYVLGKLIHGTWGWASNREWFYGRFPGLAAVPDDSKTTYGLAIGSLVALLVGIRTYRKPDVRRWTDEVTAEMTKVKWPTRKEVYGSTVVVIAGSLLACAYLFLLDQFWSFVTGLVYGTGS